MTDLSALEAALGHRFADPPLLEWALTHRSYTAENLGVDHNERFEFLGDAVLGLAVTEFLFATYPDLPEGELAKVRAASINRQVLAEIAARLGLGRFLRLGRGEESSGGRAKTSILADAMEALIAAIHLDGGYPAARRVVLVLWTAELIDRAVQPGLRDFKTRLQEVLATSGSRPVYQVDGTGPDHAKVFSAVVLVADVEVGRGSGRSKKEAEQEAAHGALDHLGGS